MWDKVRNQNQILKNLILSLSSSGIWEVSVPADSFGVRDLSSATQCSEITDLMFGAHSIENSYVKKQ